MNGHEMLKDTDNTNTALITVQAFLKTHPNVRFIRFQVHNYGNILRVRLAPVARALDMAAHPGREISTVSPLMSFRLPNDELLRDIVNMDNDVWLPDWSSLYECTYEPGHAAVMCAVEEWYETPEHRLSRDPRTALQRVVQAAKDAHGIDFLVGHEIEFVLLASSKATSTVETLGQGSMAASLREPYYAILEEAVTALGAAGIPVYGFHPEGGSGQFEIALSPLPPLASVDALVFTHEAIKTIAVRHGLHATMHPKPFEKGPPNGAHVHLSISRPECGDSFLAGLLERLPALSAITMPGFDSYQRAEQYGYGWVCWGPHKGVAVRHVGEAYWEMRWPDALANMYLALAAMIAVGLAGIETGQKLEVKPRTKHILDPCSDEERAELGVTTRMPRSLEEALSALKKDEVLREALGERLWERYVYFKEEEIKSLGAMASQDRREKLIRHL